MTTQHNVLARRALGAGGRGRGHLKHPRQCSAGALEARAPLERRRTERGDMLDCSRRERRMAKESAARPRTKQKNEGV